MWGLTRGFTRPGEGHYITIKWWGPQITGRLDVMHRVGLVVQRVALPVTSFCSKGVRVKATTKSTWNVRSFSSSWHESSFDAAVLFTPQGTEIAAVQLQLTLHPACLLVCTIFPASLCHSWRDSTDQGRLWLSCAIPQGPERQAASRQAGSAMPDTEHPRRGNNWVMAG